MPYYRITLTPLGPIGTPLVSGTLWGHVAWGIRYGEGEEALTQWLAEQEESPWLLSSFMPCGFLPKPLLKPVVRTRESADLTVMRKEKRARKKQYISESLFLRIRSNMSETVIDQALSEGALDEEDTEPLFLEKTRAHNRIDRLAGRTPQSGGLYFDELHFFKEGKALQGFAYTREPCVDRLESLLNLVGENGFGCNASTGCGQYRCSVTEEKKLFQYTGNRMMSLSHGVRTKNMLHVRYRQHVHFGKTGGHYATGSFSPFKYPLLMMCPAATFTPSDDGPFGELLHGVHHDPALASIVHYALHLPLAFSEVEV